MSALAWQDPPAQGRPGRPPGKHAALAAEMRANPGRWALIGQYGTSGLAGVVRNGKIACYAPAGSFETATRKRTDGRWDIYARFVGEVTR